MKFVGYAVRIRTNGNVRITMVEKERSVDSEEAVPGSALAEALGTRTETLFRSSATRLPIEGMNMMMVYDSFGELRGKGENELAEKLCANGTEIYGDVLLLPMIATEDNPYTLISMPLEVADTVSLVCDACRYALDNGIFDTLFRKDAAE